MEDKKRYKYPYYNRRVGVSMATFTRTYSITNIIPYKGFFNKPPQTGQYLTTNEH